MIVFVIVCIYISSELATDVFVHIVLCLFVAFVLCTLYCQFLWIVRFLLPLRYSLTFIQTYVITK
jgi:hypothetical protein